MARHFGQDVATERLQLVVSDVWVKRVDEWRRKQAKIPSRSDAVRILVSRCLDEHLGNQGRPSPDASPTASASPEG